MKKTPSYTTPASKKNDVEQAIGGQPENDRDARAAGLSSATSANGPEITHGRSKTTPRTPAKKRK